MNPLVLCGHCELPCGPVAVECVPFIYCDFTAYRRAARPPATSHLLGETDGVPSVDTIYLTTMNAVVDAVIIQRSMTQFIRLKSPSLASDVLWSLDSSAVCFGKNIYLIQFCTVCSGQWQ